MRWHLIATSREARGILLKVGCLLDCLLGYPLEGAISSLKSDAMARWLAF